MSKTSSAIIIIIVVLGVGYAYTFYQVNNALQNIDMDLYDFRIDGVGFLPPSADITLIFRCDNPSQYEIELKGTLGFYYGDSYITSLNINDVIYAGGSSTIDFSFHISSMDVINMILEGFEDWSYSGSYTATHRIFGVIPVIITQSF